MTLWRRHRLRSFTPYALGLAALLVIGGASYVSFSASTAQGASNIAWVTRTGAGLIGPACGSSSAGPTCSGTTPVVTFNWSSNVTCAYGYGYTYPNARLNINGATVATGLPCSGSYTWTGGSNGTTYSYEIWTYDVEIQCFDLRTSRCQEVNLRHTISSGTVTEAACYSPVSGSCSVSPGSATVGQSVTWTASPSGGNGSYTYSWSGTDGLSGGSQSVGKAYSTSGTKTGSVIVSSAGQQATLACSNSVAVSYPTLSASCSVSPPSALTGQSVTWTASPSGGNGSYTYSWSGTDGLSGGSQSVGKVYSTSGTKTGSVTVASAGQQATVSCGNSVSVSYPAPTAALSANPGTIDAGQSSTLSWSSANATSCTGVGFLTGGATSGSVSTGALSDTSSYQVTCSGPGGTSAPATATVTVRKPTVTITPTPPRVADPGPGGVPPGGNNVTVSWNASNVNSCAITRNGAAWKSLTADGSRNVAGSAPDSVSTQTTYVITCANNGSSTAASASAIVNVSSGFQEF